MSKLGKNEAKRLQAAALREFHSEMDEDERERMLRRGMGGQEGGLIHKGVDQLVAKKLSKEEKKAMMEQKRAALAEKKAAKMAAKEGEASEAQAKQREWERGGEHAQAARERVVREVAAIVAIVAIVAMRATATRVRRRSLRAASRQCRARV